MKYSNIRELLRNQYSFLSGYEIGAKANQLLKTIENFPTNVNGEGFLVKGSDVLKHQYKDVIEIIYDCLGNEWSNKIKMFYLDQQEIPENEFNLLVKEAVKYVYKVYNICKNKFYYEENGEYVNLRIDDNGHLDIILTELGKDELLEYAKEDRLQDSDFYDIFEDINCNSSLCYLDDISNSFGALSTCPIIYDQVMDESDDTITAREIWYYPDYQIRSFMEGLIHNGKVTFTWHK
jgi:hypothetical protein